MASADLTDAYSWRWMSQPPNVWSDELKALAWEVEPAQEVLRIFAGTQRDKMRPWWCPLYSNWTPTLRAPYNPMRRVFRSAGLVRGTQPWMFCIDDAQRDDQARDYTWSAPLHGGVWRAAVDGLPAGQVVLAFRNPFRPGAAREGSERPAITTAPGDPLLLVATDPAGCDTIGVEVAEGPVAYRSTVRLPMERLAIKARRTVAAFRVVMVPFRAGTPLPVVAFDPAGARIGDDALACIPGPDGRTGARITRGGTVLLATP